MQKIRIAERLMAVKYTGILENNKKIKNINRTRLNL